MFKRRRFDDGEIRDAYEAAVRDQLARFATNDVWEALVEAMKEGIVMRNYAEEFWWVDDFHVREGRSVESLMLGERNPESIEDQYRRLDSANAF